MQINIDGINLNYRVSGQGQDVVLLHGWGGSIASFEPVHQHLEANFRTWSLDFPGFGESTEPPTAWGTEEYSDLTVKIFHKLKIKQPVVIGHSFGGRVAIRLGAKGQVKKLVLVDSAGIRPRRSMKYYLKVYTYKTLKHLLKLPGLSRFRDPVLDHFRNKTGSQDYLNSSGVMRQTMVQVVNEDLKHLLPKIQVPTLLVWGENDNATPLADGKIMEKLIPDAGLVVFKNAGHFSYLENMPQFLRVLDSFFKDDREAADV